MFSSMIIAAVIHTQGSKLKIYCLLTQVNAEAWLPWGIHLGPSQDPETN